MTPRPPTPVGHYGRLTVAQLDKGLWRARTRYRDKDGVLRQIEARAATSGKARNALLQKLDDRPKVAGTEIVPDTRISVLAEVWHSTLDVSPGTEESYRKMIDRHIVPRLGKLRIRELTTARVEGFVREVEQKTTVTRKGLTVTTGGPAVARQSRTILSMMMDMAARYDAVTGNPVRSSAAPKSKRAPVTALRPEQVHELRAHVHAWVKAEPTSGPRRNTAVLDVLDVLIGTGLRPGEVLALRWQDVDLKAGLVSVEGTVKRTREAGLHRQERPKSDTSARTLALPRFALEVLRRRRRESAAPLSLVFTNRDGGLWDPTGVARTWRTARVGGWEHVHFRALRKAVATLIERELGMESAAAQLGHSSPEITRRHYVERNAAVDFSEILTRMHAAE